MACSKTLCGKSTKPVIQWQENGGSIAGLIIIGVSSVSYMEMSLNLIPSSTIRDVASVDYMKVFLLLIARVCILLDSLLCVHERGLCQFGYLPGGGSDHQSFGCSHGGEGWMRTRSFPTCEIVFYRPAYS